MSIPSVTVAQRPDGLYGARIEGARQIVATERLPEDAYYEAIRAWEKTQQPKDCYITVMLGSATGTFCVREWRNAHVEGNRIYGDSRVLRHHSGELTLPEFSHWTWTGTTEADIGYIFDRILKI